MIEVSGLSKYYGGRPAIHEVSFSVNKGEIVGLLGLNGAGKSTILKILGCFLLPSKGQVQVAGHSVEENPDAIRQLLGYLPDVPPLYPEMTVQSYLEFVAQLKNISRNDVPSHVDDAVMKTHLREVLDYRLGELSHGFQQRVGIAQAIVHRPKVLILDEPINGLDPIQIVEMRDLIKSLRGDHTVILSSHILSEITKTCDRILIVDQGRMVAEGDESRLTNQASKSMRVIVQVSNPKQDLFAHLQAVSGVDHVEVTAGETGGMYAVVTSDDCRAAIAKVVIDLGCELIGLHKEESGLESIFLKMVGGGQAESNRENLR